MRIDMCGNTAMRRSGRRFDRAKIVRDGRAPCRVSPGYVQNRGCGSATSHANLVNAKSSGGHDVTPLRCVSPEKVRNKDLGSTHVDISRHVACGAKNSSELFAARYDRPRGFPRGNY